MLLFFRVSGQAPSLGILGVSDCTWRSGGSERWKIRGPGREFWGINVIQSHCLQVLLGTAERKQCCREGGLHPSGFAALYVQDKTWCVRAGDALQAGWVQLASLFNPQRRDVIQSWHNILDSERVFTTGHEIQCNGERVKESVNNLDQAMKVFKITAGSGAVGLAVDEGMHKASSVDDVTCWIAKPNLSTLVGLFW